MNRNKIMIYPKTKNLYEVLNNSSESLLKNPETRDWMDAVIYREYKKYDSLTGNYNEVPESEKKIFVREKIDFFNKFQEYKSKDITFYYGMSGTFKATIINKIISEEKDTIPMWSMAKPWRNYEKETFAAAGLKKNSLNLAMLHLCLLENICCSRNINNNLIIERGVSDMMYFSMKEGNPGISDYCENAIQKELDICSEWNVKKILLVQKDKDFINNRILSEPSRAETFPGGIKEYLEKQEEYIDFTTKYNDINSIIEIDNAREFLESINIKFKEQ